MAQRPNQQVRLGWRAVLLLTVFLPSLNAASGESADSDGYVGIQVCAECHQDRVDVFQNGNHHRSWRPTSALDSVAGLPARLSEGPNRYSVEKVGDDWKLLLQLGERPAQAIPIHSVIGGTRLGLSFILQVSQVEGRRLAHSALVEARYMLGTEGNLRRSPGFPAQTPSGYEVAAGQVLTPPFAEKCLGCHGAPIDSKLAAAGGPHPQFLDVAVRCERCHGPSAEHVAAARAKQSDLKIVHPGRLPKARLMELCAQCHSGFFPAVQPRPDDILIANQVTALASSRCYIQSQAGLSCLTCHDPHRNAAPRGAASYVRACRGCHSPEGTRVTTAVCPVNTQSECVSCHMPEAELPGGFHVTDHWIRKGVAPNAYLLQDEGDRLMEQGEIGNAIRAYRAALLDHPGPARVHLDLGYAYSRFGDPRLEEEAYRTAIRLAPDFHEAYHNLGGLLWTQGKAREAIEAFQEALQIKPDLFKIRVNLSSMYRSQGDLQSAVREARQALQLNPMLASGYYALGAALYAQGEREDALQQFDTAVTLSPENPDFALTAAVAEVNLGRLDEATRRLEKLIEDNPDFDRARQILESVRQRR